MIAPRSRRCLLVLLAFAGLLGACGLSENAGPQAIPPANLPPDLLDPNPRPSTTLPESAGTTPITVYFLVQDGEDERLAKVEREVANATRPGDRLAALLIQPDESEADRGLTTSIPADTSLQGTNEVDNVLVIDLSNELFSIQGEELAKSFAQIVYTVTEVEGIRQVRFLVEGEQIRAQDAEGVEKDTVTRADYDRFAPDL